MRGFPCCPPSARVAAATSARVPKGSRVAPPVSARWLRRFPTVSLRRSSCHRFGSSALVPARAGPGGIGPPASALTVRVQTSSWDRPADGRSGLPVVTSGIGAPPTGTEPWQLVHLGVNTAGRPHGSSALRATAASGPGLPAAPASGVAAGPLPRSRIGTRVVVRHTTVPFGEPALTHALKVAIWAAAERPKPEATGGNRRIGVLPPG